MNIATQQSIKLFGTSSVSRERLIYLTIAFCGFSSVGSISLSMFQLGNLPLLFSIWVVPSIILISIACISSPKLGGIVLKGWIAGVVGVLLYDVSRMPFILAGWGDFIPQIGVWIIGQENAPPLLGYLYRYAGNGGGMGISFILLFKLLKFKKSVVSLAVLYGLMVFGCLMLTLLLSPLGQDEMFEITPLTFTGSLIGHVIYGLVLGLMIRRVSNE